MYLLKTILGEDNIPYLSKEKPLNQKWYNVEFTTPESIAALLNDTFDMAHQTEEYFYLLCFDTKMHIIGVFEISHGSIDRTLASNRELIQKALYCNASRIVVSHNHPSGNPSPGKDDIVVTKRIKEACELMDIILCDHLIIGRNSTFSLKEQEIVL